MSAVELRYAEALFAASVDEPPDGVSTALGEFSAMLSSDGDIREFLLDPTMPAGIKKETSEKLLPEKAAPLIKNFVFLLIDKNRLDLLPGICAAYERMNAERHNSPDIYVYSAAALDEDQIAEIGDKYRKMYNIPKAKVLFSANPKLLGGVLVQIGDIRVDGTLLGRLNGLRSTLERK